MLGAITGTSRRVKERGEGQKRNATATSTERASLMLHWTRRQKREPHEMETISWG